MKWLTDFFQSKKIPFGLAGFATGSYPFLFYFSKNFYLSNSWIQFGFLSFFFLIVPTLIFLFFSKFNRISLYKKYKKQFLFFLSLAIFALFIIIIIHAKIPKKLILSTWILLVPVSLYLYRFHKQLIIFQLLLTIIGMFNFVPTVYKYTQIDDTWKKQPDDIAEVVFKKKPNVYFIEPDGYASISELKKGHYKIDNSEFNNFLKNNNFSTYPDFRSNYPSTLSSNTAVFEMKHHYFNEENSQDIGLRPREILVSDNTVLNVFKNNGYKTHLIVHSPYFLINRRDINYDYCNFSFNDIPMLSTGLGNLRNVTEDFKNSFPIDSNSPHFFFIEFLYPAHIPNTKAKSKGIEEEKELWTRRMINQSNPIIEELITQIKQNDPSALILLLSDHGGYIGYEYTHQIYTKTQDRDNLYSAFGNLCAIKWPNNEMPNFNYSLKTSVNTFRYLFSYLSENPKYLEYEQDNGSYQLIKDGAPKGIYRILDENGKVDFTPMYLFENQ